MKKVQHVEVSRDIIRIRPSGDRAASYSIEDAEAVLTDLPSAIVAAREARIKELEEKAKQAADELAQAKGE